MGAGPRVPWQAAAPLAVLLGTGLGLPALAASPPPASRSAAVATYEMEAVTRSGMGAIGRGGADLMKMMMGGRPSLSSTNRTLELRLSSPVVAGSPTAEHRIPPALGMGAALPLKSGSVGRGKPDRWKDEEIPEGKGRLLIYRGCAESAGAGQPEIIEMKGLLPEQRRLALQGLGSLPGAGGSAGTTGSWPGGDGAREVPPQASLVGSHLVTSNYAPEIRFQVDSGHDFLVPVMLSVAAAGGAQRLSWQRVPTALGYQAMATGMGRQQGDIVLWTSSEAPWGDSSVPGDLRAPEATRLVQRGVLLAPERTSCTVSAQAMAAMGTAMVTFTAYGDTLMLSSPQGAPAWRLRLERRATATRPLGEGMEMFDPGAGEEKEEPAGKKGGFNLFKLF